MLTMETDSATIHSAACSLEPAVSESTRKFTGKERDAESGLDNFGARYDASSIGRLMYPDPLGGKLVDPQKQVQLRRKQSASLHRSYQDATGRLEAARCLELIANC